MSNNILLPQEKFKITLLFCYEDLKEIFSKDKDICNYLDIIKLITEGIDSREIILNFGGKIHEEKENRQTLKVMFDEGLYLQIFLHMIKDIPLINVDLINEKTLMELDDGDKDTLTEYVKSFFRIYENYKLSKESKAL